MHAILSDYLSIMTDPAHGMAEVTMAILVDLVFLRLIRTVIDRRVHREHVTIDSEHGVEHDAPAPLPLDVAGLCLDEAQARLLRAWVATEVARQLVDRESADR